MYLDPALIGQLADLTAALDEPHLDLTEEVVELDVRLRAAVPSFVGLTVLLAGPDGPLALTFVDPGTVEVGSSLTLAPVPGRVSLVLQAVAPGAFVDLAADVTWLGLPDVGPLVLDQHLVVIPVSPPARSVVEQAVGVLIGRGLAPSEARRVLRTAAGRAGTALADAAAAVLATTAPEREDDTPGAA